MAFIPIGSQFRSVVGYAATMTTTTTMTTSRRYLFDFLKPNDPDEKSKSKENTEDTSPTSSDDPVDKIFSFFFGEKEETPMGMKRFGMGESKAVVSFLSSRNHAGWFRVYLPYGF